MRSRYCYLTNAIYIYMYTNKFKSCLKSVKIPAMVPCFVVVIRGCVVFGRWVDLRTVFCYVHQCKLSFHFSSCAVFVRATKFRQYTW